MTEYKVLSTCQRRGYKLTDISIWEATRGHTKLGFERNGEKCDPPEYIDLGIGEHPRVLPQGSKIIDAEIKPVITAKSAQNKVVKKEKPTETNGDITVESIIAAMQGLVDERNALLERVEELESRPVVTETKQPEVELVDQWRIQFRWYGSWGELEQEWGYHSEQAANERFQKWVDTFGDKFSDVEIVHYKINKESM